MITFVLPFGVWGPIILAVVMIAVATAFDVRSSLWGETLPDFVD